MNRLELADKYLNDANVLYTHNTQYELMSICCFNCIKYLLLELLSKNNIDLKSVKNLTTLVRNCTIVDLNDYLDLDLDSEDFDSVGGLVIDALGRLPQTNDETTLPNGIRIKVLKVEKNRIESVRLILPDTLTQKDV